MRRSPARMSLARRALMGGVAHAALLAFLGRFSAAGWRPHQWRR